MISIHFSTLEIKQVVVFFLKIVAGMFQVQMSINLIVLMQIQSSSPFGKGKNLSAKLCWFKENLSGMFSVWIQEKNIKSICPCVVLSLSSL